MAAADSDETDDESPLLLLFISLLFFFISLIDLAIPLLPVSHFPILSHHFCHFLFCLVPHLHITFSSIHFLPPSSAQRKPIILKYLLILLTIQKWKFAPKSLGSNSFHSPHHAPNEYACQFNDYSNNNDEKSGALPSSSGELVE